MDMLRALDAMYSFGYCTPAFRSSNGTCALCSDSVDKSLLPQESASSPSRSIEIILRTSQEEVTPRSRSVKQCQAALSSAVTRICPVRPVSFLLFDSGYQQHVLVAVRHTAEQGQYTTAKRSTEIPFVTDPFSLHP